jgi:hypothetical protein
MCMLKQGVLWALGTVLLSALVLRGLDSFGVTTPRYTERWDAAVGGAAVIMLFLIWLSGSPGGKR